MCSAKEHARCRIHDAKENGIGKLPTPLIKSSHFKSIACKLAQNNTHAAEKGPRPSR
jgi:hypothetical protein